MERKVLTASGLWGFWISGWGSDLGYLVLLSSLLVMGVGLPAVKILDMDGIT